MCAPASACDTRRAHELFDGRIVHDVIARNDAAVTVRGVLTEAHVGDDDGVRRRGANGADSLLHRPVVVEGRVAALVLLRR